MNKFDYPPIPWNVQWASARLMKNCSSEVPGRNTGQANFNGFLDARFVEISLTRCGMVGEHRGGKL